MVEDWNDGEESWIDGILEWWKVGEGSWNIGMVGN